MTTATTKKIITRLPAGWPSRGMLRADVGDYIVIAHPDRTPHISLDGKTWEEANLKHPEHNKVISLFERQRWAR